MTRRESCHLFDMLSEIDDPRNEKGKRHPLNSMLAIIVFGLLCGHKGWTYIKSISISENLL